MVGISMNRIDHHTNKLFLLHKQAGMLWGSIVNLDFSFHVGCGRWMVNKLQYEEQVMNSRESYGST